ncbi:hypothetical protein APA86_33745 [Pseudomonas aeruginosa]|nr:hypothetical protein APA86_33745 [Pseudomonas aeruginosa]
MSIFDSFFDCVGDALSGVINFSEGIADAVVDNPGKTALVCVGTLATGGAAAAFAGPIAAAVGSTGLMGATVSTGTAISSLSGVALTNASLAALGGGSIAAGGGGMAAGAAVVATTGAAVGASVGVGIAASDAALESNG